MKTINSLKVKYHGRTVGTLALAKDHVTAFQYDDRWILDGFSISPLSLPLRQEVFFPKYLPFEGLFGVFDDSLPDGWGRLLVDRMLLREKISPATVNPLMRLAIVGRSGMGALEYEPEITLTEKNQLCDLDQIADECRKMLETDYSEDLDELFEMGGSSGGARPKILTSYNGEDWIIKFPSTSDHKDIGLLEFEYSQCAKACGIKMTKTKLFPSKKCNGYFGIKRFDRIAAHGEDSAGRVHMVSAGGLLESSHRIPNLDYHTLMKLTSVLTKSFDAVEQLYRLMCFNVFAHNRDDHSKNFAYLYDEPSGSWMLSPAYDLTYSNSINGEHATCVDGNGKNPGMKEVLAVAEAAGISSGKAQKLADDIRHKTEPLRQNVTARP